MPFYISWSSLKVKQTTTYQTSCQFVGVSQKNIFRTKTWSKQKGASDREMSSGVEHSFDDGLATGGEHSSYFHDPIDDIMLKILTYNNLTQY